MDWTILTASFTFYEIFVHGDTHSKLVPFEVLLFIYNPSERRRRGISLLRMSFDGLHCIDGLLEVYSLLKPSWRLSIYPGSTVYGTSYTSYSPYIYRIPLKGFISPVKAFNLNITFVGSSINLSLLKELCL